MPGVNTDISEEPVTSPGAPPAARGPVTGDGPAQVSPSSPARIPSQGCDPLWIKENFSPFRKALHGDMDVWVCKCFPWRRAGPTLGAHSAGSWAIASPQSLRWPAPKGR